MAASEEVYAPVEEMYEPPMLVEVGDFAELTLGGDSHGFADILYGWRDLWK